MFWPVLSKLLGVALILWFAGVGAILLVRAGSGEIQMRGIIAERAGGTFDFNRLQLMVATLGIVALYIVKALWQPPGSGLPDVHPMFLAALVGSQSVYLIGKYRQS